MKVFCSLQNLCIITKNSSVVIVERRRRDRINDMIKTLAQIVPGCQKKDSTTGSVVGVSIYKCCVKFIAHTSVRPITLCDNVETLNYFSHSMSTVREQCWIKQ